MVMIALYVAAAAALIGLGAVIYRLGLLDGAELAGKGGQLKRVLPHAHKEAAIEAPEIARLNTILQNIDSYDGSAHGQREVMR